MYPNYSDNIQVWNQANKKIPLLYEFIETHCIHNLEHVGYLSEIAICGDASCKFCLTLIGRGVPTPETKDGSLRDQVLIHMICHIKDTSDPNHFLMPETTRKHISDNGLMFEDLKKESPKLKSQKETTEEYDLDCAKDRGNKIPLKEQWFMMLQYAVAASAQDAFIVNM
eukprot:9379923-Ditylum_brightwellii.AAC.1